MSEEERGIRGARERGAREESGIAYFFFGRRRSRPFLLVLFLSAARLPFISSELLSVLSAAALRAVLPQKHRLHRSACPERGIGGETERDSPARDGRCCRRSLSHSSFFLPFSFQIASASSVSIDGRKPSLLRLLSHLGLGQGRAVARAGGIVRAEDALEAEGDHRLGKWRRSWEEGKGKKQVEFFLAFFFRCFFCEKFFETDFFFDREKFLLLTLLLLRC